MQALLRFEDFIRAAVFSFDYSCVASLKKKDDFRPEKLLYKHEGVVSKATVTVAQHR